MRGAQELGFSLQVTLAANFRLGSLIEERRLVTNLCELKPIGGFFHDRVAIDARHAAASVWTGFPISLNAALVATQADFILAFRGLTGVFAKR
jgi:hypothetical protein